MKGGGVTTADHPRAALSYEGWSERLAERFFGTQFAGEPIMLFVDDDCVAELAGCEHEEAALALATAVRGKLARSQPRHLFRPIEREARRWKLGGGDGPPPCLPLLALAVLAASRMRRSGQYAANNYYARFMELLDVPFTRGEVVASYSESVPDCWRMLEWWLDERHEGGLGYSTIAEDPHFTNIGFADSQTLFNSSDQAKLARFFEWIGHEPGERTDESELLASFRIWTSGRDDLSVGAQFMASSDTHVAQLGRILTSAARRWTGVVKADDGRDQARIFVVLDPFPNVRLMLAAERPEGFPTEERFSTAAGGAVSLASSQPGWYDDVPLEVTARVLRSGLRIVSGARALSLPGADIHIFRKHEQLGWASTRDLAPGEPHWLLVSSQRSEAVASYLRTAARDGWEPVPGEGVPQGWDAFRGVVIDTAPEGEVPEGLEGLVPTLRKRVSLSGGLPLSRARRVYLLGGEPDLWMPPSDGQATEVRIDAELIDAPVGSPRIRLADRTLAAGDHRVFLGQVPLSFSTILSLGRVAPQPDEWIAHVLRRDGDRYAPTSREAEAVVSSPPRPEVWVIGAAAVGSDEDVPFRDTPPLVLPSGATRRVLLGARPGDIEEVSRPSKPGWMDEAELGMRVFEHVPTFDIAWVITEWRLAPTTRTRLSRKLAPLAAEDGCEEPKLARWRDAIMAAPPPDGEPERELWDRYVEAAAASVPIAADTERDRPGEGEAPQAASAPGDARKSTEVPATKRAPRRDRSEVVRHPADEDKQASARWDLLLEWASERATGSFSQLRGACDWLFEDVDPRAWRPTAGQAARLLATLGHIEIDWSSRRWVAAPPTVALLPSAGAHALVTGGRTRALAMRVKEALTDEDLALYQIPHAQRDGPTAIFMACGREGDLEWLANKVGIRYEHSVSERLGQLLPPLDSYLQIATAAAAPARYGVERLDVGDLRWHSAEADSEPGLYRYDLPGGRAYRLIDAERAIYALDRAKATYAALSRWGENVIKYIPQSVNGTLVVPSGAPLPVLQARAAALCTGLAPARRGRTHWYRNVPRALARRIAWSLDQTLIEVG